MDSIFNQTYRNFEVIILDDRSTDHSLELLRAYEEHEKVTHFVINEQNTGSPFKQWEKGIKLAKGEFIWIAESDDYCAPNFLKVQLEHLKQADASVAKTIVFDSKGKREELLHPAFRGGEEVVLTNEQILYCPVLNVSAVVFKRELLGPFEDPVFSEFNIIGDRVFYFDFFQHKKIVFNKEIESYFRQEEGALSNLQSKSLNYLSRYYEEHVRFIMYAAKREKGALDHMVKPYIRRFYNRVRNRVPRNEKLSLAFFKIYLSYRLSIFSTS